LESSFINLIVKENGMKIYAGNLSYDATEVELRQAFEAFGRVDSATIIKDKYSGRSKGFGFVEMPNEAEARAAIEGLNGKEFKGRTLNVNEARPEARREEERRGGRRRY
jgi:RNA recognition motif-containing protein